MGTECYRFRVYWRWRWRRRRMIRISLISALEKRVESVMSTTIMSIMLSIILLLLLLLLSTIKKILLSFYPFFFFLTMCVPNDHSHVFFERQREFHRILIFA